MDYNELLFAAQMHKTVIDELERKFPNEMSGIYREQFIKTNFDGYLIANLEEVQEVAKAIRSVRGR